MFTPLRCRPLLLQFSLKWPFVQLLGDFFIFFCDFACVGNLGTGAQPSQHSGVGGGGVRAGSARTRCHFRRQCTHCHKVPSGAD